ncbi:MAG TPA: RidA family protein [Pyrinomonadaceae bacterium]|nr:RidA family protein [Pyrinomonadaceae bacterium]
MKVINPASLGRPSGYSNGLLTPPGVRVLFVAGQIGWDENRRLVGEDFVEQFDRALANVLAVVREAGGAPGSIGRMTVYVTDKREYAARLAAVGERWRALMGRHYPAMTLVEVKALLEDGAKVEIEATAVL